MVSFLTIVPISFDDIIADMSIRPLRQPGAFEPEEITAMTEALEAALKALGDDGRSEMVRERIAQRIIAAASAGERDPVCLREAGLAGLGGSD